MRTQQWAVKLPSGDLATWQYLFPRTMRGNTDSAVFNARHEAREAVKGMGWVLNPKPRVIGVRTILETTGGR